MLKEKDGKIVVPKRFMEWLDATEEKPLSVITSYRIALINRTGWGFRLDTDLKHEDGSYADLTAFINKNKEQLTRALLDHKEFIAEPEKKYYMIAPDGFDKERSYLNFDVDDYDYYLSNSHDTEFNKTQFTQSEIDDMPQKYRDFFTQVEVEE